MKTLRTLAVWTLAATASAADLDGGLVTAASLHRSGPACLQAGREGLRALERGRRAGRGALSRSLSVERRTPVSTRSRLTRLANAGRPPFAAWEDDWLGPIRP
jgi:hypothetical protein